MLSASSLSSSIPPRVLWARRLLYADVALLLLGWLGQLLSAGAGVFLDPVYWRMHLALVPWVEWLLPVALVLCFLGRSSRGAKILAALGMVFLMVQYLTAGLAPDSPLHGWALFHPLSGFALFWVTIELARLLWRQRR